MKPCEYDVDVSIREASARTAIVTAEFELMAMVMVRYQVHPNNIFDRGVESTGRVGFFDKQCHEGIN
jgi:hypothetical protein